MRRRQPIGSLLILQGFYPFVTPPVGLRGTWACQPDSAAEILRDPQANLEEPLRGLHVLRPVPDLLIANYVRFSQTGDLVLMLERVTTASHAVYVHGTSRSWIQPIAGWVARQG
jgi:hypothetical protein